MVVVVMTVFGVLFVELTEGQAGDIHQFAGLRVVVQQAVEEALKVRADPVNALGTGQGAAVGWAQGKGMGRGAGRQQHGRLVDAVEQGGADLLNRLDAGQHAAVGQNGGRQQQAGSECQQGTDRHGGIPRELELLYDNSPLTSETTPAAKRHCGAASEAAHERFSSPSRSPAATQPCALR